VLGEYCSPMPSRQMVLRFMSSLCLYFDFSLRNCSRMDQITFWQLPLNHVDRFPAPTGFVTQSLSTASNPTNASTASLIKSFLDHKFFLCTQCNSAVFRKSVTVTALPQLLSTRAICNNSHSVVGACSRWSRKVVLRSCYVI
jgi:hypothetical protein